MGRRRYEGEGSRTRISRTEDEEEEDDDDEEEENDDDDEEDEEEEEEEESEIDGEDESDDDEEDKGSAGEQPNRDVPVTVILTDPEVFDCPICLDTFTIPVFQCNNGHLACSACCNQISKKCPSCSLPIGDIRCRGLEKILESMEVACRNMNYGCKKTVTVPKKHDHEKTCIYEPCSCPVPDCIYISNSHKLYLHYSTSHSSIGRRFSFNTAVHISIGKDNKVFILQERKQGVIFILSNEVGSHGNVFHVRCIGPSSSKIKYTYEVRAENGDNKVILVSVADSIPKLVEDLPQNNFLVVPSNFMHAYGLFKLELHIWKPN